MGEAILERIVDFGDGSWDMGWGGWIDGGV